MNTREISIYIYIYMSCKLFKSPKTGRAPKKKKKKKNQVKKTRELSCRSVSSTLFRHWRILTNRCSSLSSLHRLIGLNLLINCLKIQVLQICLQAVLYQISPQQLESLKILAKQDGVVLLCELKGMDGLGHDALHLLVGRCQLLVPLLHQLLLGIQLLS